MLRRFRLRRLIVWTGTLARVLLGSARAWKWWMTIASGVLSLVYALTFAWGFGLVHRGWSVGFGGGTFTLAHVYAWSQTEWLPILSRAPFPPSPRWLPHLTPFYGPGGGWIADLPMWIPLTLAIGASAVFWHRDRRFQPGACQKCGYNLTGNTSGRCPECGTLAKPE